MFVSRTPEWIKKMIAVVTKKEQSGPVFRFFMDLSDAGMLSAFGIVYVVVFFFSVIM